MISMMASTRSQPDLYTTSDEGSFDNQSINPNDFSSSTQSDMEFTDFNNLVWNNLLEDCDESVLSIFQFINNLDASEEIAENVTTSTTNCSEEATSNLPLLDVSHMQYSDSGYMALKIKPYTCSLCPKSCSESYSSNRALMRHLKTGHSSKKPYTCPTCFQSFNRADVRKRHLRDVHSSKTPHTCPTCSNSYKRKDALQRHLNKSDH
ncbi:hypothetical protein GGI43DRAFT_124993 [Trichoderma evansii]